MSRRKARRPEAPLRAVPRLSRPCAEALFDAAWERDARRADVDAGTRDAPMPTLMLGLVSALSLMPLLRFCFVSGWAARFDCLP